MTGLPISPSPEIVRRPLREPGAGFFGGLRHLLTAALVSTAAVLIGEFLINKIYFKESVIFGGQWLALICNILILCCFMVLLLTLANRLLLAILVGLLSYGFLIAVDIIKLINLDDPLRPMDFQYLADLRVVSKSYINIRTLLGILVVCAAVAAVCALLWRKERPAMPHRLRIWMGIAAIALLISFFALPSVNAVQGWITTHGIEDPLSWHFEPRVSARSNGLLGEWALTAADPAIHQPERYSRPEVERIAHAYQQQQITGPVSRDGQHVNLIIYLIESFMDPLDLDVRFTSDPIPTFHAISRKYSSGRVVVPVFGGTSANTEFELMTGLSLYFLPASSCPYRQYVTRDIPSLPRTLHGYGYRTISIPADPPYMFNHKAVFGHLGFDRWLFPEADPQTPRSPDDEFAADGAIADATIAASREGSPYFIFAFTGGTHFPWEYADYNDSKLDLAGPMPEPYRSRLKTYINALNVADRSVKKLIKYFSKSDQKTAIFIMGDHLPPLAEIYDKTGFFNESELDRIRKRYQVPAVLWCNWPATKEDFVCSANFIASRLLHFIGLQTSGVLALNADVQSHFPVLSQYVKTADGRLFLPGAADLPSQPLLDDYRVIQYDLLKGEQYSLGIPGW